MKKTDQSVSLPTCSSDNAEGLPADLQEELAKERVHLKNLQEKYTELYDYAPSGYFSLDRNGIILELNLTCAKMLGCDRSNLILKDFRHFISSDTLPAFNDFLKLVFETEKKQTCEIRLVKEGNPSVFIQIEGNLYGNTQKCMLTATDISKLKHIIESLQNSENKFKISFNSHPGIVGISTLSDGRYIDINHNFSKILGWSKEEVIGKTSYELGVFYDFHERNEMVKILKKQGQIIDYEIKLMTKTGQVRIGLFSAEMIDVDEEKYLLVQIDDITERHQTYEALKDARNYAENLIQTANAIVIGMDKDGNITTFNKTAENLTGYSAGELQGCNWFETIVPKERYPHVWKIFEKLMEGELPKSFENPILTKSGEEKFISWHNNEVWERGKIIGTISFGIDITERIIAEKEIQKINQILKESNAAKDKFFSIIAHDLKNPFNSILGFSNLLQNEARNMDIDEIERYAGNIYAASLNTYQLLENLLTWANIQRGIISFYPKSILLDQVVQENFELLKNNANQKNIQLLNSVSENTILTADQNMLRTILLNLISNAIKFTPKKGWVRVSSGIQDTLITISVSDNGVGMTEDAISKLFSIETSLSTRGTENEKGTGLGLLLCKEFVEKHGGTIHVESQPGKGSTFSFSLSR